MDTDGRGKMRRAERGEGNEVRGRRAEGREQEIVSYGLRGFHGRENGESRLTSRRNGAKGKGESVFLDKITGFAGLGGRGGGGRSDNIQYSTRNIQYSRGPGCAHPSRSYSFISRHGGQVHDS